MSSMDNTIRKEWSFDFDYSVSLGETYTKFMEKLREKRLIGNKCGDRTFFPPLPFCSRTFELPSEWLESDGEGTIEAFTINYQKANSVAYTASRVLPEVPYIIGVIKIDNSEQCLLHFLSGPELKNPEEWPEKIQAGMRVRPVWSEERSGTILDIKYFEPVK